MGSYKQYNRTPRGMATEQNFAMGMRYTDTPLAIGYAKNLVNFDLKDSGAALIPRNGYRMLYEQPLGSYLQPYAVHHTAQGAVRNTITEEDLARRYVLFSYDEQDEDWFDFSKAILLLEQQFSSSYGDSEHKQFLVVPCEVGNAVTDTTPVSGEAVGTGDTETVEFELEFLPNEDGIVVYIDASEVDAGDYTLVGNVLTFGTAPGTGAAITAGYAYDTITDDVFKIQRNPRTRTQLLHNVVLTDYTIFNGTKYLPAYAILNNTAILPVNYTPAGGVARDGFAMLKITTTDNATFHATLEYIEPKALTPTEALNYGYNMLSATPYTFNDVLSAAIPANYILLEGILPYADEACTTLRFNAKVGEKITFRLFAQWPDEISAFKFRWEFRELGSDNVTIYEDQALTTRSFVYPTPVTLTVAPPYKQFGIVVTAYATAALDEPIQVLALGSYHLTSDTPGSTANIEVKNYPLYTASDMCTWKQHIVLWGVQGADNLLFVGDLNVPGYFPYPNNAEVFEDKVVICVPYLGDLLVFTESKLFRLKWSGDGLSFTTDMIQDKLFMSPFDKETIVVVQNMVFFKNGNYFYMVVPKSSSSEPGALQLAPISTPITNLLDKFQIAAHDTIFQLYNPSNGSVFPPLTSATVRDVRLHDYYNFLDNSVVRNVYKFKLADYDRTTGTEVRVLLYVDYILNYDTMSRAWTSYMMQSNDTRLTPYRQNVTDTTIFVAVKNTPGLVEGADGYEVSGLFIKPDVLIPEDDFPLAGNTVVVERLLRNHQLLDTGYRDHDVQVKKRYREIQFKINNSGQHTLQFGTEFLLDDNLRKALFRYETRHVTDINADDFGYVYVERVFDDPVMAPGTTILGDEDSPQVLYVPDSQAVLDRDIVLQSSRWVLDVSRLADASAAKVRFRVSGKGYAPRLILVSFNDKPYEMLAHNWVYRIMNAR